MSETRETILIVDDEESVCQLLEAMLEEDGYSTHTAASGPEALQRIPQIQPDLILLDIMMPGMSGYEVARRLKSDPDTRDIPIIIVTALEDRASRIRGLQEGAEEFLSKPIDRMEMMARIRNLLRLKEYADFQKSHNRRLEEQVKERTLAVRKAFHESIHLLMRASEFRDDETGEHVMRVSYYSKALGEALHMDSEFCDTIFYASPMHDIGKIGIPDDILLKPGSFTPQELVIMKTHTHIGGMILQGATSPYLLMGEQIALYHHERWDGSGYMAGLKGEDIPLPARIMQIADIYDALRSKRPYKPAFNHAKAMHIILQGDGRTHPKHFDPEILRVFESCADQFAEIFQQAGSYNANASQGNASLPQMPVPD